MRVRLSVPKGIDVVGWNGSRVQLIDSITTPRVESAALNNSGRLLCADVCGRCEPGKAIRRQTRVAAASTQQKAARVTSCMAHSYTGVITARKCSPIHQWQQFITNADRSFLVFSLLIIGSLWRGIRGFTAFGAERLCFPRPLLIYMRALSLATTLADNCNGKAELYRTGCGKAAGGILGANENQLHESNLFNSSLKQSQRNSLDSIASLN